MFDLFMHVFAFMCCIPLLGILYCGLEPLAWGVFYAGAALLGTVRLLLSPAPKEDK